MKTLGTVTACLMLIPATIGSTILRAWVLTVVWGWFVVSMFHLPELHVVEAVGLCMVTSLLTFKGLSNEDAAKLIDKKTERLGLGGYWLQAFANSLGALLILLGAWVWHSFL